MTDHAASASKLEPGVSQLRCIACAAVGENGAKSVRCAQCGDLLEVVFPGWNTSAGMRAGGLDAAALKQLWLQRRTSPNALDESGVWRFREILPALNDWNQVITLREGNTPLYQLPSCGRAAGVERLFAKHQGMNPTGSFKDTGMTAAASFARQGGFRWVACASTGNTSASMAAYAARAGMRSLVLIPQGQITWGKLSQALDYGAVTCQLKTDFDGCMRVLDEVVERMPVYLLNSVNPYRLEGQKTAAVELLEMKELGLLSSLPKLSVIQAEGANALVRTMRETGGKKLVPVHAETMATAIKIGSPASWKKAVRVLEATGGAVEQVSEVEIALAKAEIGADGIGCEPASAVTLAGLKKLLTQGFVKPNQTVVLILTGNLLKDPDFTLKFHRGDLFAGTEHEEEAAEVLAPGQRAPMVLDASANAVVKVLEYAEQSDPGRPLS